MAIVSAPRARFLPSLVLGACVLAILVLTWWTLTRHQTDHWTEVARAREFLERNRPDLAFQAVTGIRDEKPGAAEALALAARALLMQGTIAPARQVLERSLKMKREQPEAAKMLAAIYLAGGDGKRAIDLLKQAAELDPRDFRPWFALGRVYHNLGEMTASRDAYSNALERSPPAAEARQSRLGRIRALLDSHQDEQASPDLTALLQANPEDPQALALAARQAVSLGQMEEALRSADRALSSAKEEIDALLARGRVHFQARRFPQAAEDLLRATELNPNDLGALQLLGQTQLALGRKPEADATLARAERARERRILMDTLTKEIDERPLDPEPRVRMGKAAIEGRMHTLAFQCFQAALDLSPGYEPAREGLRMLQREKGFDPSTIKGARPEFGTAGADAASTPPVTGRARRG
ncbi:MAG: tetratricopeptide repeat protein [Isosphaeraceae bacterium]